MTAKMPLLQKTKRNYEEKYFFLMKEYVSLYTVYWRCDKTVHRFMNEWITSLSTLLTWWLWWCMSYDVVMLLICFIIFRFDLLLCLGFCFFYKYVFVCCVVVFMHYFVFFQYVFLCFVMFATTPVFYKSMLGCYPCSSLVIFLTTMYRLASYWKHTADGLSLFTPTQTGWNNTGWHPT